MGLLDALIGAGASIFSANQTNAANKKIMQNQVQWRVADAKAAGIHPLAALGANVQPVPSQPLLGDAALGGLATATKDIVKDPLQERQERANARLTEANATLAEAQSRTLARAGRQPPGATIGGNNNTIPPEMRIMGERVRRDASLFSRAQTVQDEMGDVAENVVGVPSLIWSLLNARQRRYNRLEDKRVAREYGAYRRSGGTAPAWMWLQQRRR